MSGSRLIYYRDLVRELVARDIKVRYKRSLLGFAWTFANPLLYLVVFLIVTDLGEVREYDSGYQGLNGYVRPPASSRNPIREYPFNPCYPLSYFVVPKNDSGSED